MKVLMVCLGNICRSPLAEGILRHKAESQSIDIEVDSCGTANYHVGEHPDPRSISKANDYGIDISTLHGRQFTISDFDTFDHILVMDKSNYQNITRLARNQKDVEKVEMMLNFSTPGLDQDVPDPYYGGIQGFENVYQMLDKASDSFIRTHIHGK